MDGFLDYNFRKARWDATVYFGSGKGPRERKCAARRSGRRKAGCKDEFWMEFVVNAVGVMAEDAG